MLDDKDSLKTQEELQAIASKVQDLLNAELSPDWEMLERPSVLAYLFAQNEEGADVRNVLIESTQEEYVGMKIEAMLPNYIQLFDTLKSSGFGKRHAIEVGNGVFVYALEEREVVLQDDGTMKTFLEDLFPEDVLNGYVNAPKKALVKALVLETQNHNYIALLNNKFDKWTIHVRRVYPSLDAALANSKHLGSLNDYKDRSNLTLHDVVRLASMASEYADDYAENPYPKRLSLPTFLAGSLVAGEEDAGAGLRYADGRDRGYVVSLQKSTDCIPCAKDIDWGTYREVANVMRWLNAACYDVTPDGPDLT